MGNSVANRAEPFLPAMQRKQRLASMESRVRIFWIEFENYVIAIKSLLKSTKFAQQVSLVDPGERRLLIEFSRFVVAAQSFLVLAEVVQ